MLQVALAQVDTLTQNFEKQHSEMVQIKSFNSELQSRVLKLEENVQGLM